MPMAADEYVQQTKALIDRGVIGETIEPTSAVLHYTANSSMVGSGYTVLPDFGFLVSWLRYGLTAEEFEPSTLPLWKYSQDELRQRRGAAEAGFDQLLEDFVRRGYEPEMGQRLLEIGNDNFHEFSLNSVYVLPGDLDELLDHTGNPFVDLSAEDEEAAIAAAPPFDLSNPEHRARLAERLAEVG